MEDRLDTQLIYNEYVKLAHQQESLLFQRFNYFLLANSFITIAFITVFVQFLNNPHAWTLELSSALLGFTGLCLSWIFAIINLMNIDILKDIYDRLVVIEDTIVSKSEFPSSFLYPFQYISRELLIQNSSISHMSLKNMSMPITASIALIQNKRFDKPGPHTWVIPVGFSIFWFFFLAIWSVWHYKFI